MKSTPSTKARLALSLIALSKPPHDGDAPASEFCIADSLTIHISLDSESSSHISMFSAVASFSTLSNDTFLSDRSIEPT